MVVRQRLPCGYRGGPLRSVASGGKLAAMLALTLLTSARDAAAAPPNDAETLEFVGPLRVSTSGRSRVRGDRPEHASIHLAWAPPAEQPDRDARETLEAFEREHFPEHTRRYVTTIVERPPEPWMAKLTMPDLPVRWNSRTVEYLRYFRDDPRGRGSMQAWMRRAGRYELQLRRVLRRVGIPEDLVFVALAESGFNPRVRSHVGAAGMWQFMEGTAQVYGLRIDHWVDERFDVEKSTFAAALYLKDLKARFGSWELALAAYNAGYGLVLTAIERANSNNYWALSAMENGLPHATANYVPKIVAAALVGRNRKTFACDRVSVEAFAPVTWIEMAAPPGTTLASIAADIEEDEELIVELNAHYVRGRTPPGKDSLVRIPKHKREAFERKHPAREKTARAWRTYVVKHGDRPDRIAAAHAISERELRRINGIRDAAEVQYGVTLLVPNEQIESSGDLSRPLAAVPPLAVGPHQRIVVFEATRASTPASIEQAFAVRWSDVVAWNDLDASARLQSGQLLQIAVDARFDSRRANVVVREVDEVELVVRGTRAHLDAALASRNLVRRGYAVRSKDTMERIAKRFDLTIGDLARINGCERTHVPKPGDTLIVYVPRTRTRGTREAPEPVALYAGYEREPWPAAITGSSARRAPSVAGTARVPGSDDGAVTTPPDRASSPSPATQHPEQVRTPSTPTTSRIPGEREP